MILGLSRKEGWSLPDSLREAERYVEMGIVQPDDPARRRPRIDQRNPLPGVYVANYAEEAIPRITIKCTRPISPQAISSGSTATTLYTRPSPGLKVHGSPDAGHIPLSSYMWLADAFNAMAESIDSSDRQRKALVSDVPPSYAPRWQTSEPTSRPPRTVCSRSTAS
jgi:hypothetical protein